MNEIVHFADVYLGYAKHTVIKNVCFAISSEEFLAIVGTNGSGKTTLLRGIMRMLAPLSGEIKIDENIRIGYVPQKDSLDSLFPLTVAEVIEMGMYGELGLWKRLTQDHRQKISDIIKRVGLSEKTNELFRNLSGGQRQKALIARALVSEPNCLVLDEPTTGIDLPSQHEILHFIHRLQIENRMTVIMVTHDLNLVMKYAENIAIIHEKKVEHGSKQQMITETKLSEIYNYPIKILEVQGHKMVVGAKT